MAADSVADGDYLGEYSRFFAEFAARVNPNDQLPVKVSVHDVNESELVGEVISVTLQYLNRIYCPPSLQSYITYLVILEIKSICKKQPEVCGLRQQEKTYAPLKLMQAITNEVNEICRRYLDNSRLALLPPPSSTPQVTVGAIRNARRKMEDRHMILHDLNTIFNISDETIVDYYAVFDGHGGQDAAAYCATHLHQYLVESVHYPKDPGSALRDAFLTTDAQFIAKSNMQKLNGGTTAVCVLLINKLLYIAWVGDSMASLVSYGDVTQLVNPHRPTREDETKRIHNMGGVIVHCMGVSRVNGFLSVSRAIGDVPYKPYITGEPEVRCIALNGNEDFLIIACDGLWDYVDQRTAALRVYRQVQQNPYDLKHVHQALLQSAKRAGSLDNITVIVVFLTPPIKIASRSNSFLTHQAPNGLLLNNMDPNNPIPSNHDEFDVKPTYIKQLIDDDVERADFDMDLLLKNSVCGMTRNGKHRNDDDDEYDYTDIGPETDVDAGEDVHDNNYPLAASSSLDPSPESEKSPMETEKHNDDDKNDDNYSNRDNANVCPVDSVVDDDDVDNRVRPSDRDVHGADDETLRDNGDDARIETAGKHTVVDDDESPPSPRATKPLQHSLIVDNVADSEDSEDEWDYYRIGPNKQESAAAAAVEADESRKDIEEQSAQENPEFVVQGSSEVESSETENDIKCEELVKDTSSLELINIDISDERKSSEPKKDQILLDLQEETREQDNMDFQLNPEAAEFVPLSPPLLGPRGFLQDFAISGSPLKQTQVMDDIPVPSQSEFDKEVCHRPKEIGEEFSNDEHTDLQNNSSQSMDLSEISSTKAEMGDDESMHVMSTSHWQSNVSSQWNEKTSDDVESDVEEDDVITRNNPMAMSLTPGNFKEAFEKSVDLNAVHMLDDSSDGAEQVSTPPRSPEPFANEDRAHTPLSDDKNPSEVLRASTPQPSEESSMFTMSSDTSSETKNSSSLATTHEEKKLILDHDIHVSSQEEFSSLAKEVPGIDVEEYSSFAESQVKDVSSTQYFVKSVEVYEENVKLTEENKEEEKEVLCKIEDDKDTSFIMKPTQLLQNCSQMIEKESMESEISKNLPDSTNHSNFNDAIHVSKQYNLQQSLSEKMHPEMASDMEQTHYHANFDFKITSEKDFEFNEPLKIANSESSNWENSYQTENFENKEQKEVEELSNKIVDDDVKPDSTTELNLPDSKQFKFVENEPQHNQMLGHMPIETITLIDKPTEQEQIEEKIAEFAPINVDEAHKEKVASEDIPSKEEESIPEKEDILIELKTTDSKLSQPSNWTNSYKTENIEHREQKEIESLKTNEINETESLENKITKASLEDTATINKSKEVTGITEALAAVTSPIKAKTATTSAKRPTKTTTTKATTASTKTVTKSMPSPKAVSAASTRTTTTSSAQSTAKKPVTSTATRPKQLDGSTKAAISSTSSKITATKTTTTTKAATTITATRTNLSPRVSSSTRPKTTTTTSLKASSGIPIEKKSTVSGDAKSVSKPATTTKPTSSALKTTTSTTTKTTLVKTSPMTAKTLASSVTLKSRPTSATSTAKTTSTSKQPSATGVNGTSRTRISSGTTKRESIGRTIAATTTKSPLIDKQSKETVNKQISRSGASAAPKIGGRTSAPTGTATAGATKTRTPSGKSIGNVSATSPTKKTPTSKTRTSSTATKRLSLNEAKVLQNGIPKEDVTKAAVITATNKLEDDVPRKDTSPVNVPTDNQLIAD